MIECIILLHRDALIVDFRERVQNLDPGTFDNYLHHWVDATAGGRFVPEGITSPVVSTSVLAWISIIWSFL